MSKFEDDDFLPLEGTEGKKFNYITLRANNELYDDERNVTETIINVKRVQLKKGGEDWQIFENGVSVLIMKGTRFTNSEKEFLRSVEGMKFLIAEIKNGRKSVVKIKESMKKKL